MNKIDKILSSVAKGELNDLDELYDMLGKLMYVISYSILKNKDDAEDALQETFVEITKSAHTYIPGTNGKAWILAITKNVSVRAFIQRSRQYPVEGSTPPEDEIVYLTFDRPFCYMICDMETGTPIFMGTIETL